MDSIFVGKAVAKPLGTAIRDENGQQGASFETLEWVVVFGAGGRGGFEETRWGEKGVVWGNCSKLQSRRLVE